MSDVENIDFEELQVDNTVKDAPIDYSNVKNIKRLYDVPVEIKARLGKTSMTVEEILKLEPDYIIQLNKKVGENVEIFANNILIGYGEIVVVNDDIGVKITKINADSIIKAIN